MATKKYLKLKINPDEIDLDTIQRTCEIQNSELFQEVTINDVDINPDYWSRDKLIQQFNLLTVYPWFWKNVIKSKVNTATLEKAVVYVQIDSFPGGLNVPIDELKHFESNSKITKKLYLKNDFIPLTFLASDSEIATKGQTQAMIDQNGQFLSPPKFSIDNDGEICLDIDLNLYTSWTENGKKIIDKDISGFYYEFPGVGRYAINENSFFILEFEYPRSIYANKLSITNYINNPEEYYYMDAFSPWPPEKNYSYTVKDKHETLDTGGYANAGSATEGWLYGATIIRVNEPNVWVGPYGQYEPNLQIYGAIDKREITDNQNLMDSVLGEWQTNFNGWYLKYDVCTFDAYWGVNDGSQYTLGNIAPVTDLDEEFCFNNKGEIRRSINIIKNWYKPNGKKRDELFPPGQGPYDPNSNENILYMSGFINGGKYLDSNAPNTPYIPPVVDNEKSFCLKMNIVYSTADVTYVNIKDNEGPQAQNQPHTGYGRLLFKSKSMDENMFLDKENKIPSLIITKEDTSTFEYGNIMDLTYVKSNTRFRDEKGNTQNYGSNVVNLLYNVYFVFNLEQQNPNSTRIGMIIEAQTNTDQLKGCYGTFDNLTPSTDSSINQMSAELINIIYTRAQHFYKAIKLPEEEKDPSLDHLYQYYDGIAFGNITNKNIIYEHHNIETWENIFPIVEELTNKILYKVIKFGNIWIIDNGEKQYLSYPLINNGLIIIKNGGQLIVRSNLGGDPNAHAYILNNGVIIRENGGILTLETPGVVGQKLLRNVSNIQDIVYEESGIRDLKDNLHSTLIPSNNLKMVAQNNIKLKPDTNALYSKDNMLLISTNATDTVIPTWNNRNKHLNFNLVSPTLAFDGLLSKLFFSVFIPDFLVFKWWESKRNKIEDNILGIIETDETILLVAESVDEFENGNPVVTEIPLLTDKTINNAMGGIYLRVDLEDSGELILGTN